MLSNGMNIYYKLVYSGEKYRTKYNQIQKNSNSEQHFKCFHKPTFQLGCSQDSRILMMTTTYNQLCKVELYNLERLIGMHEI